MKPLLSIIIATKNRVPYCINCIETILNFTENAFELVVQDNTDNFELKTYIELNIFDKRLVYNYTPPPFSSIDNFNAAMRLATGEYVCLIGDDDGINPEIFDVVRWANNNNVDSICPTVYISYLWPNALTQYPNGNLSLNKFTSQIFSINPKNNLLPLLNSGIINYMNFQLPKVYHGIVKRDYFEQIFKITGHYFGGLSPDIYSAVALASLVKNHYIIDYPLTISGACNSSTTVDNLKGDHAGRLEAAPHFRDRSDYIWDENIPKYYSVQTIWAESAIKAIKELNIEVDLKQFNLPEMVSMSLLYNKNIRRLIFTETNKHLNGGINIIIFYIIVVYCLIKEFFRKVIRKISSKADKPYFIPITNVIDIKTATKIIVKKLKEKSELSIAEKLNKS